MDELEGLEGLSSDVMRQVNQLVFPDGHGGIALTSARAQTGPLRCCFLVSVQRLRRVAESAELIAVACGKVVVGFGYIMDTERTRCIDLKAS